MATRRHRFHEWRGQKQHEELPSCSRVIRRTGKHPTRLSVSAPGKAPPSDGARGGSTAAVPTTAGTPVAAPLSGASEYLPSAGGLVTAPSTPMATTVSAACTPSRDRPAGRESCRCQSDTRSALSCTRPIPGSSNGAAVATEPSTPSIVGGIVGDGHVPPSSRAGSEAGPQRECSAAELGIPPVLVGAAARCLPTAPNGVESVAEAAP